MPRSSPARWPGIRPRRTRRCTASGYPAAGPPARCAGDDASDAAKTKLVVATSPDFPPFESLEGGEVVGIEVDILKKVAEKMGMELEEMV